MNYYIRLWYEDGILYLKIENMSKGEKTVVLQREKNVRIASSLAMTYDNKTKEIHKHIQGHGCLGRDKGAEDPVRPSNASTST